MKNTIIIIRGTQCYEEYNEDGVCHLRSYSKRDHDALFFCYEDMNYQIYVVDKDGSNLDGVLSPMDY